MTKQEFEHHIHQIIMDAVVIGRYRNGEITNVQDIIASHERSIEFHREELNKFYDRHQEEE